MLRLEPNPCETKVQIRAGGPVGIWEVDDNYIYGWNQQGGIRIPLKWVKETGGRGPIKMAIRKVLFERVMDIQRRSGVTLITPDDEAFIRTCWKNKVYPRGWSAADELNEPIEDTPLLKATQPKDNP